MKTAYSWSTGGFGGLGMRILPGMGNVDEDVLWRGDWE